MNRPTVRRVKVTHPVRYPFVTCFPLDICAEVYTEADGYQLVEVDGWETPHGFLQAPDTANLQPTNLEAL